MARIPEETIRQVIESNDIVEVLSGYIPDLKRSGSSFKACCPFHMEKSPSFHVTPSRQFYKCFGCGESGDVLSFVKKIENLPFTDAIKKLASRVNIPIIQQSESPEQIALRKSRSRIIELHNDFAKFLHHLLLTAPEAQHARDYLESRGFTLEMAKNWMIGWQPPQSAQVIEWAKSRKYKAKELVTAGVASANDDPRRGLYYRFHDRLMFPIHNDYGDIIAFSGRQLREDPRSGKYINSPETLIFKKSKVFFGLDKARREIPKSGYALLCEGQIDVIACHEHGFPVAIATQGTACTPEHAQILKRYTKKVLLCFDSDAAGQKATQAAFVECARVGIQVSVVLMPQGEDPDSYIKAYGTEAFQEMIDQSKEFFDYKVRYEASIRNLNNPNEKAELAREMSELLAAMTDNFQLQASLSFLSTRLGISEEDLRKASRKTKQKQYKIQNYQKDYNATTEEVQRLDLHASLGILCHIHMTSTEAYDWMQEQIEALLHAVEGVPGHALFQELMMQQPRPEKEDAVSTFLATLRPIDEATLRPYLTQADPSQKLVQVTRPLEEAQAVFSTLSIQSLERERKQKTRLLANPDLEADDLVALQREIQFITQTLNDIRTH